MYYLIVFFNLTIGSKKKKSSLSIYIYNGRIPSQDKMADAFGQQAEKDEEISAEILSKALHDKRVVMVATATNLDEIESTFRGYFTHQVVR